MNEAKLKEYAELIVKIGANVQKGQRVRLQTGVDQVHEAESRLRLLLGTLVSLTGYPWDQLPANSVPPKTVAACQEAGEQILRAQLSMQDSAGANPAKDRIRAISEYVQENYTDSELSVGTIAARFGMNAAYLSRAFKDGWICRCPELRANLPEIRICFPSRI